MEGCLHNKSIAVHDNTLGVFLLAILHQKISDLVEIDQTRVQLNEKWLNI